MSEVITFPVKCCICKREITGGMIYYHDKDKGYVCEACPQFDQGGVDVDTEPKKEKTHCIDCGVETKPGMGAARCPKCWDEKHEWFGDE